MSLTNAKKLRAEMTDAERRIWYNLRGHRFGGLKFRRQVPIGPYIVDFICFEHRLIVELDGGQHADNIDDRDRDEWLRGEGYKVLRFWNNDVLRNTNTVLEEIARTVGLFGLSSRPSPGSLRSPPSPQRMSDLSDMRHL